ncbi:MAG: hypothetical protein K940chlam8_00935 [Chlamydiae bacterium]|nr:hypothetical protein [Chlamydiota bacterium]
MRCSTFCTADRFDIKTLYKNLKDQSECAFYHDVIHLKVLEKGHFLGDAFFFDYGAIVFWGLDEKTEQQLLNDIKPYEIGSKRKIAFDDFSFSYGEVSKIYKDEIILQTKNILAKLTVSYGLSQSVKLDFFEEMIETTIASTRHLPEDLAKKGKIRLSRKEISRRMGGLFLERNSINLHTDILDTPEFFWEYADLEPLYRRTCIYLDISSRVEVLNKRLGIVHELFEMLGNELNHQHSSKLEWTIIWLIVIEVVIALLDVFNVI